MFDFCLPTKATTVPSNPDWLHEINTMAPGCGWNMTVIAFA
jgi:hypothetical protein